VIYFLKILRGMEQITKVLLALTPILAVNGVATFGGACFLLSRDFSNTTEERFKEILGHVMTNTVDLFNKDLFSTKMGPLLYKEIENNKSEIIRHELALIILLGRPRNWKEVMQNYLSKIQKDSFYLFDIFCTLRYEYKYSFASPSVLNEISYLIKIGIAKHQFGYKKLGLDKIRNIPNTILPKREKEND